MSVRKEQLPRMFKSKKIIFFLVSFCFSEETREILSLMVIYSNFSREIDLITVYGLASLVVFISHSEMGKGIHDHVYIKMLT